MDQSIIDTILRRNKKVDLDKAWETSWTRRISVSTLTYIVMAIFLWVIDVEHYLFGALVPTLGFMISTFKLQFIRTIWEKLQK